MAKAFDVAEYLLSKADATENDMTHMKLQKLLYYCQGFSLGIRFFRRLLRRGFMAL